MPRRAFRLTLEHHVLVVLGHVDRPMGRAEISEALRKLHLSEQEVDSLLSRMISRGVIRYEDGAYVRTEQARV